MNKRVVKYVMRVIVAVAVILPLTAVAQQSSVNSFSPYTMYGVGELSTQGALPMRSLGGIGVAWRSSQTVNLLNPAGYSAMIRKSMLFDFGVEGMHIQNAQNKYDTTSGNYSGKSKNAKNTINFHEIAFQVPVAKGMGVGFSLTPYSSVGYNMVSTEQNEDAWGSIGRVRHGYTGDGDITEVKVGFGWEIFKNFSLGVAGMYYWGNIQHNYTTYVANDYVGDGEYVAVTGLNDYSISRFKFQVGAQYNILATEKRLLTIGATYDLGGSLKPKVTKSIYINDLYSTTVSYDENVNQMRLPEQIAAGILYQDSRYKVGADYVYQSWGGKNSSYKENIYGGMSVTYRDTNTFKFGFEYTPNRFDVRSYLKRMSYRVGGRYGNYYQKYAGADLNQYAITAGIGFPIKFMGASMVDIGIEYGGRGSSSSITNNLNQRIGLIKQQYIKFSIGISMFGDDYWFVRPKYD